MKVNPSNLYEKYSAFGGPAGQGSFIPKIEEKLNWAPNSPSKIKIVKLDKLDKELIPHNKEREPFRARYVSDKFSPPRYQSVD